jgi:hypothetical protein
MLASRLGPAGGAGTADDPAGGGVGGSGSAGRAIAASHRSRSSLAAVSLPSIASAGLSVSASEPEKLSWPSASLKSLAATAVCETSTLPSKLNLPASSGGSLGCGWPAILAMVSAKRTRLSAELDGRASARVRSIRSRYLKESFRRPPPARPRRCGRRRLGADRRVELSAAVDDGGVAANKACPASRPRR